MGGRGQWGTTLCRDRCRLSLAGPVHRVSPGVKLPLSDAADMTIWFFSVDDRIICLFPIKYVDGE